MRLLKFLAELAIIIATVLVVNSVLGIVVCLVMKIGGQQ
jgi:hypothetical protein